MKSVLYAMIQGKRLENTLKHASSDGSIFGGAPALLEGVHGPFALLLAHNPLEIAGKDQEANLNDQSLEEKTWWKW